MRHILISIVEMLVVVAYCNLIFRVIASEAMAYEVNSMLLIHSPFVGMKFLTSPVIALIAIQIYFTVFAVCEKIAYEKD